MIELKLFKKRGLKALIRSFFWFSIGAFLGLFFLISFALILFEKRYSDVVYPGVSVHGVNFGGKKQQEIRAFFAQKNAQLTKTLLVFKARDQIVTVSVESINLGYDGDLLAKQAYGIGRSPNILSNVSLIFQAYLTGISLPASYHYEEGKLEQFLSPLAEKLYVEPVEALFTFQNGRVIAFRPSLEGQSVDIEQAQKDLSSKIEGIVSTAQPQIITITIPIKVLKPKMTTDKANNLGIKELIASGTSLFQHSIPNRIYNISLATTRLNGHLVPPGETFSFGKALGDVSAFTGYKQAYIIQGGKTILGDGGGVCQVSTTFFRALLNAGLPILERHQHDYRVGYYEQDSAPGFDATVYVPNIDLRFKNDTQDHILIQTEMDQEVQRLTFFLYGTKDERQVTISKPVITNRAPAPSPLYQDDPSLPKGTIKQVDFAAEGATAVFTRQVLKNGKVIIADTFVSNYRPWQAVYLRGMKE